MQGDPEDVINVAQAFSCPHCGHNIDIGQMQQHNPVPYQVNRFSPPHTGFGDVIGMAAGRAAGIAAPILQDAARKKAAE